MATRSRVRDEDEDETPTRTRRAPSRRNRDEDDDAPERTKRSPRRRDEDDDEEEEEKPRRRSHRDDEDDDDEEEEKPRRRSRRSDDDDEDDDEEDRPKRRRRNRDDEDERPKRRRSRRDDDEDDDDEEEEKPRRRSRRDDDDDDDERPKRRRKRRDDDDDDDDEDERPKRRRRRDDDEDDDDDRSSKSSGRKRYKGGWGEADKVRDSTGAFATGLKLEKNETQIIKFLEDSPYVSFKQHWIDELKGQKSFTCLKGIDPKGCPLCDIGDRPTAKASFNVAVLSPDEDPVVRSWDVGVRLQEKFKNFHRDRMVGPLDKYYFAVTRTGKGGNSDTNMLPVRPKDLYEAYDVEPLSEDELEALDNEKYDAKILHYPTHRDLKDIVRQIDE